MSEANIHRLPALSLDGRRILVTGAARGLGLAFTEYLAQAGAQIAMVDVLGRELDQQVTRLRNAGLRVDAFLGSARPRLLPALRP